uniref:Cytochrome c oxidase subunit 2 n=1 Tax=Haania sp. JZ-2017 TaxID=2073092 RepID=A0A343UN23_9NEOP|nr:cytochrome c oxidase subunit II [Haania sp. JZ-2017]
MSTHTSLNLQDSASSLMEQLMYFHDHSMFIIMIIISIITIIIMYLMMNKNLDRNVSDGQFMEILWTILPTIILIFIALPSLRMLYLIDENSNPMLTLKTIGHQWYWNYEYSDFDDIEFNSYMMPQNEMNSFNIRALDVDTRTALPMNILTRILITSEDVIHSWTIPSMGVKADATPGRLNQSTLWFKRPGVFYGQCSEICGTNHSFMPIVIESISINKFFQWLKEMIN